MKLLVMYVALLVLAGFVGWVTRRVYRARRRDGHGDRGTPLARFPTILGSGSLMAAISRPVLIAAGLVLLPALVLAVVAAVASLFDPTPRGGLLSGGQLLLLYGSIAAVSTIGLLWMQARRRSSPPAAVELYSDRICIPRLRSFRMGPGYETILLDDLATASLHPDGTLLLETRGETISLAASALVDPNDSARLESALTDALKNRPGGEGTILRSARDRELTREYMSRPARATRVVLVVLGVVFAAEIALGLASDPGAVLLRLGGNVAALVDDGEWFRLFSAGFLHVDLTHVLFNALFIGVFGPRLERIVGPARFVSIYLLSGIAGAGLASRIDAFSVGASASAFGLLGALGVLQLRCGESLPAGLRIDARGWATLLVLNLALPFMLHISWAGHVGGLVAGASCAFVFTRSVGDPLSLGASTVARWLAAGLVLVHAFAATRVLALGDESLRGSLLPPGAASADDPAMANAVAWSIAIDATAGEDALREAEQLARRAVEELGTPSARDTLAQVLHRQGRHDEAVLESATVYLAAEDTTYATQLARFLGARLSDRGTPMDLEGVLGEGDLALEAWSSTGPELRGRLDREADAPIVFYALYDGGLLRACLPEGTQGAWTVSPEGDPPGHGTPFELAYLERASGCGEAAGRFIPADDPEMLRLP